MWYVYTVEFHFLLIDILHRKNYEHLQAIEADPLSR